MSERRYRIGTHPAYDKRYERLKIKNPILSPKNFSVNWIALSMSDKAGLESLLYEHAGDQDGNLTRDGVVYSATLKTVKENLAAKEQEAELFKQRCVNMGSAIPEELPQEIQDAIYEAEADLDLELEVVGKLTDLHNKANAQLQQLIDAGLLKYGPAGMGKMDGTGQVLAVYDGQKISKNSDGLLFIDEPRSPYYRMLVQDYRKFVVIPFVESRGGNRSQVFPWSELPPWPEAVPKPELPKVESVKEEKSK